VFLWVKLIEATLQLRPRALWRVWLHPDPEIRHAMRWYTRMGRRVWLHEFRDALRFPARPGQTVAQFWGEGQLPENTLAVARKNPTLSATGDRHGHRTRTEIMEPLGGRDDGQPLSDHA
jgi:anaerobic magnesium-protoporphyrin IX monomethyl ester cyclase